MERLGNIFEQIRWETMLFSALRIVLILIIGWIALHAVRIAVRRMEGILVERARGEGELAGEAAKRAETLARLIRQAAVILIWVLMGLMILREIGIEIAPILASAGIVGLAIGFGAQNLVRDVITGFFMILENQIRVGDTVVVNETRGLVERINLRTIVLRDASGVVHVFPNGSITTLANETREWSGFVFEVGVSHQADLDRVFDVMRLTGRELRQDTGIGAQMIEDIEIFGIERLAESTVSIKGRIKTRPGMHNEIGREFLLRLKKAFDREGIQIPLPQYAVTLAAPLSVRLLGGDGSAEPTNRPDNG